MCVLYFISPFVTMIRQKMFCRFKTLLLSLLFLLPFGACQKAVDSSQLPESETQTKKDAPAAVLREYSISPVATDPAINSFLAAHFVSVNEGAALKNTLFLFIPGTYRVPAESKGIERKAASLGYHTIGLSYPNEVAGNPLCKETDDITCHRRARLETIDGIDRHPSVNVDPANSILNRLTKLLLYLERTYPAQNWGQFLSSGDVNWSKVIVCGHSQGAALAGVIGKTYPIKKVIMLSMIDFLSSGRIPDWETMPANKEKFFALTNTKDELVPYDKVTTGWNAMGMSSYGPIVNVGETTPPYQSTHTLITTVDPSTTLIDKYHNGTAIDTYIPMDANGKYIYDQTWEYLIDAEGTVPPGNQPPIANAGADQTIPLSWNYNPTLNGTPSKDPDGWIASFSWSKVSGPSSYTIVSPNAGQTKVNDLVAGTYVFRLAVTDNKGATGTDDVQITMTGESTPPSNQPPVANAGADQTIPLAWNYNPTLNGTPSKDPDGWIASFSWSKISGPSSYTIVSPNAGQTKINDLVAGTYVFRLTVTDNKGATGTDDVQITITGESTPPSNQPPIANAGADLEIPLSWNYSPTLNGTPSKDPDGWIASFSWSKVSGPSSYTIVSPNAGQTKVNDLAAGTYVFRLTVTDNKGATGTDDITVRMY
ncbi:MAG: hypothetical protein JNL51_14625 [Chitinophagaceae bacterium]|nr:hypothetical protein [Chitinophagaceae bacterium]